MGNHISCIPADTTRKVILPDGRVHRYDKPTTVADLMLEYPQQVVVELQPSLTRKRPSPLPADQKLEMRKVYFMVPVKRGKPVSLSSEDARRLILRENLFLKSRPLLSSSGFIHLFAQMCSVSTGIGHGIKLHKKENFVEKSEEVSNSESFDEILEGRPEYLSRQYSGKGWKPKLDTIKEKGIKTKIRHWLF